MIESAAHVDPLLGSVLVDMRPTYVLRRNLIDPAIEEHSGTIVQTGGDSLLVVFDSNDGAVRCTVHVEEQVPTHDGGQPTDQAIRFRIGINIGDAIADGSDRTVA